MIYILCNDDILKGGDDMEFKEVCRGKILKEIWQSEEVKEAKSKLRKELQLLVSEWCKRDRKRRIPVYISLKPKRKIGGLYFQKKRGNGAIVIFPIVLLRYPYDVNSDKDFYIRDKESLINTLAHEYAHHLSRDASPHGKIFQENFKKVRKRLIKRLGLD